MKKFTKEISASGKNGTFAGIVEVQHQYRSEKKEVHNRGTHDEEMRTFEYSRAVGFYNNKEVFSSQDVVSRDSITREANRIEKALQAYLQNLADASHKTTSLEEDLSNLGFK